MDCKIKIDKTKYVLENSEEDVPFRLSDNIKEFITEIGLDSLFPAVMTCCSLAVQKKETYVKSFLRLFFYQSEAHLTKPHDKDYPVEGLANEVMQRMLSLGKPYFDKDISQLRYLADQEEKEEIEARVKMANLSLEEDRFNKLAFDLVHSKHLFI